MTGASGGAGAAPLVTVVIPAYNAARFLASAIDSVLAQTVRDLEVIVVDDGSQDGTSTIAERYGSMVRCIRQPNQGVSGARNRGASASSGRYIAYLDADDEWRPRKLELQLDLLAAKPRAVACFAGTELFDDRSGRRAVVPYRVVDDMVERLLLSGSVIGNASAVLMPRATLERVGGFDPSFSQSADWDMWLRLARLGELALVEDVVVRCRVHGGRMSTRIDLLESDTLGVLRKFFSSSDARARYGRLRRLALGNHYAILAGSYLRQGSVAHAIRCVLLSVLYHPRGAIAVLRRATGRLRGRGGQFPF